MELLTSVQSVLETILMFVGAGLICMFVFLFWYIVIGLAAMCTFDCDNETPLRIVSGFILFVLIPYGLIHTFLFFRNVT